MPIDELDIILRLSNLQSFIAGSREAAASVREVGAAAREGSAESATASRSHVGATGLISRAWKASAVAVAAFGYESAKMAIGFDKEMELVHTQAGASQNEVVKMSNAILQMSASGLYAQGPTTLAEGLFHLESIGLRGAKALDALKIAAQGAAVGNASLEDTTTALGSAWLVNIKGAGSLNNVMSMVNATVGAGNMRMEDLVTSLGTGVLPAAKLAGLGIKDVFGALAVLSDEGWRGSSAMAQFATSLHYLTDPTKKARVALSELHLGAFQLANIARTQGLPAALAVLRQRLQAFSPTRQAAILGDILPAGRGRVLEVLMNQVDRYNMKIHQITKTSSQFAQDITATHRTAAFRIKAAWSEIQAAMIRLGHILQPVVVWFTQAVATMVKGLVNLAPTIIKLAPVIGSLVAGLVAYKVAMLASAAATWVAIVAGNVYKVGAFLWSAVTAIMAADTLSLTAAWIAFDAAIAANPIVILIGVLVAFVALIVYILIKTGALAAIWKALKIAFTVTIHAIVAAFQWLKGIFTDVVNFVVKHWRQFILLIGPAGLAIDFVTKHFQFFKGIAVAVFHVLASAAKWAWGVVSSVFNWIVGKIAWFIGKATPILKSVFLILTWPYREAWKIIKAIFEWIVGKVEWAVGKITHLMSKILGPIKSVAHFLGGVAGGVGSGLSAAANFLGVGASGLTASRSGWAIVGEQGPEVVQLPQGARVIPMSGGQTVKPLSIGGSALSAAAASFAAHLEIPVVIDRREVARATGKYVDDRLARQ